MSAPQALFPPKPVSQGEWPDKTSSNPAEEGFQVLGNRGQWTICRKIVVRLTSDRKKWF